MTQNSENFSPWSFFDEFGYGGGTAVSLAGGGYAVTYYYYGYVYETNGTEYIEAISFYAPDGSFLNQVLPFGTNFDNPSPSAVGLSDGSMLLLWAVDGAHSVQVFSADGTSCGPVIPMTLPDFGDTNTATRESFTALDDGGFQIVWHVETDSEVEVVTQAYDSAGVPVGEPVRVIPNVDERDFQMVETTILANGNILTTWVEEGDDSSEAVGETFGIITSPDGSIVTDVFQMNSPSLYSMRSDGTRYGFSAVDGLVHGGFVIAGETLRFGHEEFWVEVYDETGALQFNVELDFTGLPYWRDDYEFSAASVAALPDGGFVVGTNADNDYDWEPVYVQFDAHGNQVGNAAWGANISLSWLDQMEIHGNGALVNSGSQYGDWDSPYSSIFWSRFELEYGGTIDADVLAGSADADFIYASGGNDRVSGFLGDDMLNGGFGRDFLNGGRGNDILLGEAGRDTLFGGRGDDLMRGGADRDTMDGGSGADEMFGGAGSDDMLGRADNDVMHGGSGNDWMFGANGDDLLNGDAGNDFVIGGNGVDDLNGGAGDDWMFGGEDADVFRFDKDSGRDGISDFEQGVDTLVLDDGLWGEAGLTHAQVLERYTFVLNGDLIFKFDDGERLEVRDVADAQTFVNDLVIG